MQWIQIIEDKIFSNRQELAKTVNKWKMFNEKVVFTNGCFDILHLGHIDYLAKAASLGDRLVVALNTDSSVKKLKGEDRPIIDEHTRLFKMAAMSFVDAVILFDEETPLDLITELSPDVLVKGGDYVVETIVGAKEVLEKGGSVEIIPFVEGHSTSALVNKMKNS